jgi:hypothetical protein
MFDIEATSSRERACSHAASIGRSERSMTRQCRRFRRTPARKFFNKSAISLNFVWVFRHLRVGFKMQMTAAVCFRTVLGVKFLSQTILKSDSFDFDKKFNAENRICLR